MMTLRILPLFLSARSEGPSSQEGKSERDNPRPDVVAVVEDDPDFMGMVATALQINGFGVITADDGRVALETVHARLPDVVLLDMVMPHLDGFEVARRLGQSVITRNIPIIAMTGHAIPSSQLTQLQGCIDDFLEKPFAVDELITRITLCLDRSRRMRGVNPLTQLPGNAQIQETLINRLGDKMSFALLHIDLDEFKGFNDRYGFLRGDEAIRSLAGCCAEAIETADAESSFLGHIGGDDFAAVIPARHADDVANRIAKSWDERSSRLYDSQDAAQGFIVTSDRRGQEHRIPLMTVSIGVATNERRPIASHWEASEIAAEMKRVAKNQSGSAVAIDRRTGNVNPGS